MLTAFVIILMIFFATAYLACELIRENNKLNMYKRHYYNFVQLQYENQKKSLVIEKENKKLNEKVKDLTTRLVIMKYLNKNLNSKRHFVQIKLDFKKMGKGGIFSEN